MTDFADPTPPLETERMRLRAYRETDFHAFAAFYQTDASRFVGGPLDAHAAWRTLAAVIGHGYLRGYGAWALEEKSSGSYVGQVALWNPEGWPEPEVGWMIDAKAQGRGYATEAGERARRYAYEVLGWPRIVSCIEHANTASIAVAERLDAAYEGDAPHPDGRVFAVYAHPTPKALGLKETRP